MDEDDPKSLAGVERLRIQLEENMDKLQTALRHWQTWEAEYEGLKEELQSLPEHPSAGDLRLVENEYEGDLVTAKEIRELFGQDKSPPREVKQITGLIDRRIDYVQRNVESLKKQCDTIEGKLNNIAVIKHPEARNEDGLPIRDIYEELDDDGNVISSRVSQPDQAEPQILSALAKAGINAKELEEGSAPSTRLPENLDVKDSELAGGESSPEKIEFPTDVQAPLDKDSSSDATMTLPASMSSTPEPARPRKKSVSFAENTKAGAEPTQMPSLKKKPVPMTNQTPPAKLAQLAKGTFNEGDRVVELDEDENAIAAIAPRMPVNESAEAAALRRRMLEYNLREVGNIVAQIDLDEDLSEDEDVDMEDDELDEGDTTSMTSSAEDENEYGISRNGVMTEEYRKEMLALEARLNARMLQNVGPNPQLDDENLLGLNEQPPSLASSEIQPPPGVDSETTIPKEKSVRFADKLDVAPAKNTSSMQNKTSSPEMTSAPIKDSIVERAPTNPTQPSNSSPTVRKPSRFKASRLATPSTTTHTAGPAAQEQIPHRSAHTPLAETIVERSVEYPHGPQQIAGPPSAPDELDPTIHKAQVADEYFRLRNKLISKEGGFSKEKQEEDAMDEEMMDQDADVVDIDEKGDNDQPKRNVSLFKAARLSGGLGK